MGRPFLWATHRCGALATYPKVGRTEPARVRNLIRKNQAADSLPIWSCSVCGLPCPLHYCGGGALLPHLFTLTPIPKDMSSKTRAVYFLWHFPSNGLEPALPDVIRHTALWSSDFPLPASEDAGSGRPVQLPTCSLYAMAAFVTRLPASGTGLPDYAYKT